VVSLPNGQEEGQSRGKSRICCDLREYKSGDYILGECKRGCLQSKKGERREFMRGYKAKKTALPSLTRKQDVGA